MSDSVARNTGFALATQVVTASFTAGLTLYLVRALGPEDFGLFSLAAAVSGLLLLPSDFGISQSVGRFIAERRTDGKAVAALIADAFVLKLGVGALISLALAALAGPISSAYGEPELEWPLRAIALALFGQSLMALWSSTFISVGKVSRNLRLVASESAVEASASVLLVALGGGAGGAALGRAVGYLGGALIGLAIALRLFGRGIVRLQPGTRERMRTIGRYAGALLVVNSVYTVFNQADVLLIQAILGATAVGVFAAPLRLTALLHYVGLAVSNSVSPRVAGEDPDIRSFTLALRWLLILQAAIIAPLLAWSEPITDVLLGSEYEESADVLRALTPFIFLQGIGPLVSVSVNYLGAARKRVPIAVAAVLVNVGIDLALLGEIGVVAAAIGSSAAYLIYVPGHLLICRRLLGIALRPVAVTVVRSLLACGAAVAVMLAFTGGGVALWEGAVGGLGALAAFCAVIFASGEISVAEAREVIGNVSRRLRSR